MSVGGLAEHICIRMYDLFPQTQPHLHVCIYSYLQVLFCNIGQRFNFSILFLKTVLLER